MGARERLKGANFERAIARKLNELFPGLGAKRGFQYRTGSEVADVIAGPMWAECKAHKVTSPGAAWLRAARDCEPGFIPVAVCKSDRKPVTITMALDDFAELVDDLWEHRHGR